jgi:hypothetical protein
MAAMPLVEALRPALCSPVLAIAHLKSKIENQPARVAELADAPDLGSGAERRAGSSPVSGTELIVIMSRPFSGLVIDQPAQP